MIKAKPGDLIIIGLGFYIRHFFKKQPKTGWLVRLWCLKESVLIYVFRLQINKIQGKKRPLLMEWPFFSALKQCKMTKKLFCQAPFPQWET